jgi:hypothetical protein
MHAIYDDDNIRVVFRAADSPLLLVTFNPASFLAHTGGLWGARFADTLGCAALGFVSKAINWFPAASIRPAAAAAAPVLAGFAEIITCGLSLGGYGALKYGSLLRADLSIAFSPQSPTVRAATPCTLEARNPRAFDGLDVGPADLAPRAYLFHDPLNAVDRRAVDVVLGAGAGCVPVPTYGSGHLGIRACVGVFGALVEACRADDRAALFAALARGRREFRRRPVTLAGLAARSRPALAEALHWWYAERFTAQETAELHTGVARAWARAGQPSAAQCAVAAAHAAIARAVADAAEERQVRRLAKARTALAVLAEPGRWLDRASELDALAADLFDQPLAV